MTIKELLADPSLVHDLLSRALPDETVDRADVARRLELLLKLDPPRLRLDRHGAQTGGELTHEHLQAQARQEAERGTHTIYSIDARHHRVEPFEANWEGKNCQSVRVSLPEAEDPDAEIWTYLGVVKAKDHKLFSIEEVVRDYQTAFGRAPTVGRADFITGARHLGLARFSPISIVLAYTNPEDTVPAFYFLESGSAQGNPARLYYAPEMAASIHTQAAFKFSPMACKDNWFTGGLHMDDAGVEPTQVYSKVAQEKDGSRTYLHLSANFTVIDPGPVNPPLMAQLEASLRVFALARGMGEDVIDRELQDVLARCALEIYKWDTEPPSSGTSEGYFGCPAD